MIHVDLTKVHYEDLDEMPLLDKGRYTFEITGVEHSGDDKPHIKVRCKVMSGPSHIGGPHLERFYLSENAMKRFANFLKRMGLVDRSNFGTSLNVDEEDLIGRRVIADVVHEEYQTKRGDTGVSSKWGYMSFWAEGDEPGGASGRTAKGKRVAVPPPAAKVGSADEADQFSDI